MIQNRKDASRKKSTLQPDEKAKIIKIEKMMNYLRLKQGSASEGERIKVHGDT